MAKGEKPETKQPKTTARDPKGEPKPTPALGQPKDKATERDIYHGQYVHISMPNYRF